MKQCNHSIKPKLGGVVACALASVLLLLNKTILMIQMFDLYCCLKIVKCSKIAPNLLIAVIFVLQNFISILK